MSAVSAPVQALLKKCAKEVKVDDLRSEKFALAMDKADPLAKFRKEFFIPKLPPHGPKDKEALYFCGNSLGPLPKRTRKYLDQELDKWALAGVEGHFCGDRPWAKIDEFVTKHVADVVGAKQDEVAVMNSLSVNVHLMMVSFYRPKGKRTKILMEAGAFCSDQHIVNSQVLLHGGDPKRDIIELAPSQGSTYISTEDILAAIEKHGDTIALILFGGVQFYTGQAFEMEKITKAGHAKGCMVGFDCAHAVGNIELQLHEWNVDFACWCSYKYLNAGPGGIGGVFLHERHADSTMKDLPRLAGWWGQELSDRFAMKGTWQMKKGAQSYQMSNPAVMTTICLLGAVEVATEATMKAIRAKSEKLTGYLEYLISTELQDFGIVQLTPRDMHQRGCQLSLMLTQNCKPVAEYLVEHGVICDKREPNVIRVSPAPLFNSFHDVFRFVPLLKEALLHCADEKGSQAEAVPVAASKGKKRKA